MKLILKKAKIINPDYSDQRKRYDIAIRNGKIEKIGASLSIDGYDELSSSNLHVSVGFFDIGTLVGEPGYEHREDLQSINHAAAAGGYTGLAPFPNNQPITQSKSEVKFLINNTQDLIVDFYPIGAISKNCEGEDITEFMDMNRHGAVAFSDGKKAVVDAGLMLRSLQYAKACNGLIINHPKVGHLSHQGQMHEGEVSVTLGLEGLPVMAETLGLNRDCVLAQYAETSHCAYNISSKGSIEILNKHELTKATVSYLNLLFNDKRLKDFNQNLKVLPPIREEKDRKALVKALKKDMIHAITSGHTPLEEEAKKKSFAFADFGAIGIETVFPAVLTSLSEEIGIDKIVEKLTLGPREILGIDMPKIEEGAEANLCIFDPSIKWQYNSIKSKSKNTPFLNQSFTGKVIAVINNKKIYSDQHAK